MNLAAEPALRPTDRVGWRERWLAFRNGLVARPGFQRWAAGFPLTRRTAQVNTRKLFDLCAGFVYAQILQACVRLDLFRMLQTGPASHEALAPRLGLTPERALRLLRAAAALDLLRILPDGRFALADLGAALLGNPGVAAMIEHHGLLYDDLRDPVALLRGEGGTTRLSSYWPYATDHAPGTADTDSVAGYSALMTASQALIAGDVLDAYPFHRHRHLMDVGGGDGAFAEAVARRHPGLSLSLFDLPAVAVRANARLTAGGLEGRVACHGGSFFADPLPSGPDVISLVRIVHDHDDERVRTLLHAVHAALPPGGRLVIAEPMAGTAGAGPVGDAYFAFYLLAMGSGRARAPDELRALLSATGFTAIRAVPMRRPLLAQMIVAERPAGKV